MVNEGVVPTTQGIRFIGRRSRNRSGLWPENQALSRECRRLFKIARRRLIKAWSPSHPWFFETITRVSNQVVGLTRTTVSIRSSRPAFNASPNREGSFEIELGALRALIVHTVIEGYADTQAAGRCSNYSSSLLGLARTLLADKLRQMVLATGKVILRLLGTRYFFSGGERDQAYLKAVHDQGGAFVVFSLAQLQKSQSKRRSDLPPMVRLARRFGFRWMMDCGITPTGITVDEYDAAIDRYQPDWYLQLDVLGDAETTRRYREEMVARGKRPIPIWQVAGGLPALQEIVQNLERVGSDVIAVGGTKNMSGAEIEALMNLVHEHYQDQLLLHWLSGGRLQIADPRLFSVDSSTPVKAARFGGQILTDRGQRFSRLPKKVALVRNVAYSLRLSQRGLAPAAVQPSFQDVDEEVPRAGRAPANRPTQLQFHWTHS